MEIIFLGTGTSQGVPMIACPCEVCRSSDPRDRRTRTSVHVVMNGLHIQVDATQEFRLQCLVNNVEKIDVFILTHGHADHITGMDDLRRFCDQRGGAALKIHCTEEGKQRVQQMFPYAIGKRSQSKGYPAFLPELMPKVLEFPQGTIRSTLLPHGNIEVLGLVFEESGSHAKFAYYTDCKTLPPEALALAQNAHVLALDGLRHEPHPSHLCISEACALAQKTGAHQTYLTHLTHSISHQADEARLPQGIKLAYDGLKLLI